MIDPEKRNAIYQSHLGGMRLREISRRFQVSRNTVRVIIRQQGAMPQTVRKDKIQIDPDLLRRLYDQCDGWMQRIHRRGKPRYQGIIWTSQMLSPNLGRGGDARPQRLWGMPTPSFSVMPALLGTGGCLCPIARGIHPGGK